MLLGYNSGEIDLLLASTFVCLSVFLVLFTATLNPVFCGTYPKLNKGGVSSSQKKGVHLVGTVVSVCILSKSNNDGFRW